MAHLRLIIFSHGRLPERSTGAASVCLVLNSNRCSFEAFLQLPTRLSCQYFLIGLEGLKEGLLLPSMLIQSQVRRPRNSPSWRNRQQEFMHLPVQTGL